jgi:hypothetical protein
MKAARVLQHRLLSGLQNKLSARRADVQRIAQADTLPQVGSSRPLGSIFTLIRYRSVESGPESE